MILAFLSGIIVSICAVFVFTRVGFIDGVRRWIGEVSQFVFLSGHPLLDDDDIARLLFPRFRAVLGSFLVLLWKTVLFMASLVVSTALTSVLVYICDHGLPGSWPRLSVWFPDYLAGFPFVTGTLVPLVFMALRKRGHRAVSNPYSAMEQFLHYLFLGNSFAAKAAFRLERWLNRRKLRDRGPEVSIYVSGLARAGTTVLMQYFSKLPECKSLSYRNMPFIFMPVTWPRWSGRRKVTRKERLHADRIMHDLNSPEALEEPFWLHYSGREYIRKDMLVRHVISEKAYSRYAAFRTLVAGKNWYLSKNNNHLLRAASLNQLDVAHGRIAHTVIPFRRPADQAASLLRMHRSLGAAQKADRFVLDYMDLLVHHEFGLHRKTPCLDPNPEKAMPEGNPDEISFWLEVWYIFYRDALDLFGQMKCFYFFCYERFVEDPEKSMASLFRSVGLPESRSGEMEMTRFTPRPAASPEDHPTAKYEKLYDRLMEQAINNHG